MNRLALALMVPLALAVGQQQLLLRLPPRLVELQQSEASSGPASLELQFSRPMDRASVAATSRIEPPFNVRWLGNGNRLKLSLAPGSRINGPISLTLAGHDRRQAALPDGLPAWL